MSSSTSLISIAFFSKRPLFRDLLRSAFAAQPQFVVASNLEGDEPSAAPPKLAVVDGLNLKAYLPLIDRLRPLGVRILVITEARGDYQITLATSKGATGFVHQLEPLETLISAALTTAGGGSYVSPGVQQLRSSPTVNALLTPREMQVFEHAARGASDAATGEALGLAAQTVESHRSRLMRKLRVRDWTQLIILALQIGAVPLDELDSSAANRRSARRE